VQTLLHHLLLGCGGTCFGSNNDIVQLVTNSATPNERVFVICVVVNALLILPFLLLLTPCIIDKKCDNCVLKVPFIKAIKTRNR